IRQRNVDNDKDPEVSTTSELFALACGPTWNPISIYSCVVDGVRNVVHSRDEHHITQNSGICSPGLTEKYIMTLPGPTAVTVEVRIVPLHTMYPAVALVALLTEVRISRLL
nr:S-adenosyl-L-methionine-dependent methyltransferases superfamily protein [Tanacetum cinerariifolium]